MTTNTLLLEIFTEELPPKALKRLGESFAERAMAELRDRDFLTDTSRLWSYATPRRLAVQISDVLAEARDQTLERNLPPVDKSLDAEGNPTHTLQKALSKFGLDFVTVPELERRLDGKTERFFYRQLVPGPPLIGSLESALQEAIESLPIPKVMRYQAETGGDVEFVRPAHGLVALHGANVVPVSVLGLTAGRTTHGHRFQGTKNVELANADEYENKLLEKGGVIASFTARRAEIERQLNEKASALGGDLRLAERNALLDEVTALVEMPTVYLGEFEVEFLAVPQECLILTMQANQKYFPLFDGGGKLIDKFLIVSNMRLDNPKNIIEGNQRVIRPRLADARFFYEQDRKVKLADRVPQLAHIVYHNKLGSQLQRVERLQMLGRQVALVLTDEGIPVDEEQVSQAAYLSKADLTTNMVGEFPELQGIMGTYYARDDGEDEAVSHAIEAHYHPRFASDTLPGNMAGTCVAIADRLDALVGMFGVGQAPTGDKDPFALRRAALGVLRILIEKNLPLNLMGLLKTTHNFYPPGLLKESHDQAGISIPNWLAVSFFIDDRARSYLREQGYTAQEVESVVSLGVRPAEYTKRLNAVRRFLLLPEATGLAESDKRIRNILRKSGGESHVDQTKDELLSHEAEKQLVRAVRALRGAVDSLIQDEDFEKALLLTAQVHAPVRQFFDDVMVNVENIELRNNRFALLHEVAGLTNRVANLSSLAT